MIVEKVLLVSPPLVLGSYSSFSSLLVPLVCNVLTKFLGEFTHIHFLAIMAGMQLNPIFKPNAE